MKHIHRATHPSQQVLAALVLTSILSLGAGMAFVNTAAANSVGIPQGVTSLKQKRDRQIPRPVVSAVSREIARSYRIPSNQLRVVTSSQQSWPNTCLGLEEPGEACGEVFIENGWRVVMSNGRQNWIYRTDSTGRTVRLESQENPTTDGSRNERRNLPDSVTNAVLREASRQSNLSIAQLRIAKAEQREWPNGCLGIVERDVLCTRAIVPGWQVTVKGGRQTFVYRTNESGSVVKLESGATQGNSGAVEIPRSELPPPLGEGVVFRAISSGGITGRTYETHLLRDGTVIQEMTQPKGLAAPAQRHKISRQQLQQFERLLDQEQFSQFNQLSYPVPNGAADYITVTLTSRDGTTRYADIAQNQLPEPLKDVIQAWNQIANSK